MPYRDVLAVLTTAREQEVLRAAELIADKSRGRLTALHVFEMPVLVDGDGPGAIGIWPQIYDQIRQDAAAVDGEIAQQLKALQIKSELRMLETPLALADAYVGQHAMHADISVMAAPRADLSVAAFEGALFSSGRPVVLIPREWVGESLSDNVLIAWKATREAARAVADAAPFINAANNVIVLTVDAEPDGYGEGPGRDIAAHLARDGARVEVRNVAGNGRFAEAAIVDEAKAVGADLIVMGGYGHGRLMEFVLGGVTRSLSRSCPIPILMSH